MSVLNRRVCFFWVGCLFPIFGFTQNVTLSRLAPGNPQQAHDVLWRVDLFNESDSYADVSGYLLLTRYFALRIPDKTFIRPYGRLRLGRNSYNGDLDLSFAQISTVVIREVSDKEEGDFMALLTPSLEMVDGFVFGPRANLNFLPDMQWVTPPGGRRLRVKVPDESDPIWRYLRATSDPAMAFVRINNRWRPNSRTSNLLPATKYRDVSAKYIDGIATVKWRTLMERDCYEHILERSTDGKDYRSIERVSGPVNSEEPFEYTLYDPEVERNRLYYYRITHTDKFGNVIHSPTAKLRTQEMPGEFTFDVIRSETDDNRYFDVRFSSKAEQQVRVKLMDEALREIDVLFYGKVEAERQTLINYQQLLPTGKYYLIVSTERRRYYEPLIIE